MRLMIDGIHGMLSSQKYPKSIISQPTFLPVSSKEERKKKKKKKKIRFSLPFALILI